MPRILAISSQVASGHVGLSAIVPAAQLLGHDVIALATVILSNHPGHRHVAGTRIEPQTLEAMLAAIHNNGWLGDLDAVLTGYLPTPQHVEFARNAIDLARHTSPHVRILCDPVIGDEKEGIYIDRAAAIAIRQQLVPVADVILPNAFELGWLTNREINGQADAIAAARSLGCPASLVTSVAGAGPDLLINLLVHRDTVERCTSARRHQVPKGTGDFLSGVFAVDPNLHRTVARVDALISASIGRDHLAIAAAVECWRNPPARS